MPSDTPGRAHDEHAPDRRVWRRTLAAMWFAQMTAIVGFAFAMPFLRLFLRDELGVVDPAERASWASFIFAAPSLMMAISAPLWGALADRVGRKPMVLRAMFAGAIIIALMGVATRPSHILMLRLTQGAVTGTITAAAALVASVSPADRGGFSMGMMQAAIFVGNAVGFLLGGLVADTLGYRAAFFIAALCLWAGGAIVALFADEGSSHPREARREKRHGADHTLRDVIAHPAFLAIIGLMFAVNFTRAFPGALFQEYVDLFLTSVAEKARVNTTVGRLLAATCFTAAVTSVVMGRLADRVGHGALIVAGTIMAGVVAIPHVWVGSLAGLLILRVLGGVAAGTLGPAMGRFVHSSIPRTSHGKAFGLVQSANSCARGLGTFSGGRLNLGLIPLYGVGLALRVPFAVAGGLQLLVGFAAWVFIARRGAGRRGRSDSRGPTPESGSGETIDRG